ncbi:MAG: hypothetical protein D6706_05170 [Chloroflexi bacterium]|nr:MAG: hypothetical protein D6706_05170 [Chloroflexota bacterium]
MKEQVHTIIQQTQRYYYEDGIGEMTIGLLYLLIGILLGTSYLYQEQPFGQRMLVIGLPLLVLGGGYVGNWLVRRAKQRVTYSRTGYVAYRKPTRLLGRWIVGLILLGWIGLTLVFPQFSKLLPLVLGWFIAISLGYIGYRINLPRFYALGGMAILVATVVTLQIGEVVVGTAVVFIATGVIMLLTGGWVFGQYLRHHPVADKESE